MFVITREDGALFEGQRELAVPGVCTVRQLCRAVEAELGCGCSVALLHEGLVLSTASGGLAGLPARCDLAVRRREPRNRDRRRPQAGAEAQEQPPLFPAWQDTTAAAASDGAALAVQPAARRSVDFLLAGNSVKANPHLARFAAAPFRSHRLPHFP